MTESKPTEGNDHKEDGDVDDLEEPDLKVSKAITIDAFLSCVHTPQDPDGT